MSNPAANGHRTWIPWALSAQVSLALGAGGWALAAVFDLMLFYPSRDSRTGLVYAGIGIDPVSPERAEAAARSVLSFCGAAMAAIALHVLVIGLYQGRAWVRWVGAVLGLGYWMAGGSSMVRWLQDPSVTAHLVYGVLGCSIGTFPILAVGLRRAGAS